MPNDASGDIVTIGADNQQQAELQRRTSKTGRDRYTVTVSGDSIVINTNEKALGKPVADAIGELLKERIRSIAAQAAPATIAARKAAAKAFSEGKAWALKRYGGGRIGSTPPNQSDRLFNDSGRLEKSVAVGATKDGYTINVAANRFDASTFNGGEGALAAMFAKLKQYVPELADPSKWFDAESVRKAVKDSLGEMMLKARDNRAELIRQRMAARIQVAKALLGLVA